MDFVNGTILFSRAFGMSINIFFCRWDIRKLSEPLETLIMHFVKANETQDATLAQGVSALEYEPTIPTRFMVGTEHGSVLSGNRKGKAPNEKIPARYQAHLGPVYACQRNPAFVKIFMTVGDWICKIWTEDCKDSPIIWTKYHKDMLTSGTWSPTKYKNLRKVIFSL